MLLLAYLSFKRCFAPHIMRYDPMYNSAENWLSNKSHSPRFDHEIKDVVNSLSPYKLYSVFGVNFISISKAVLKWKK